MSRHGIYDLKYGFIPDVDCPEPKKPQTNADKIRSMSDEELADWICEVQDGESLQRENYLPSLSNGFWLKWLKQEVKENGRRTAEEKV